MTNSNSRLMIPRAPGKFLRCTEGLQRPTLQLHPRMITDRHIIKTDPLSCSRSFLPAVVALFCASLVSGAGLPSPAQNVLRNPGFEETGSSAGAPVAWSTAPESAAQVM